MSGKAASTHKARKAKARAADKANRQRNLKPLLKPKVGMIAHRHHGLAGAELIVAAALLGMRGRLT